MKQTSIEAKITALEAQICSQPMESDVKKDEEETPKKPAYGRKEGILW